MLSGSRSAPLLCFVLCIVRWQKSEGRVVRRHDGNMTAEDVRDAWADITDFSKHTYPSSIGGIHEDMLI